MQKNSGNQLLSHVAVYITKLHPYSSCNVASLHWMYGMELGSFVAYAKKEDLLQTYVVHQFASKSNKAAYPAFCRLCRES